MARVRVVLKRLQDKIIHTYSFRFPPSSFPTEKFWVPPHPQSQLYGFFETRHKKQSFSYSALTVRFLVTNCFTSCVGIAQSVLRLAPGWTVRGSNPGMWGETFRTPPDRFWGPPSILYNGYRDISGSKAEGTWC